MNPTTTSRQFLTRPPHRGSIPALAAALVVLAGCAGQPTGADRPAPPLPSAPPPAAQFVPVIDNPYLPWPVGATWEYRASTPDGVETTIVTVTDRTKVVAGVVTTVVSDKVWVDGVLLEATEDWYAQDDAGNVWYFGEATVEYVDGQPDPAGSWQAGVDGARAGIAMPAAPRLDHAYYQEYLRGEAEDEAVIVGLDASTEVPFGSFSDVVRTEDFTRLEPGSTEYKYYARGVGNVLVTTADGSHRTELVRMTR